MVSFAQGFLEAIPKTDRIGDLEIDYKNSIIRLYGYRLSLTEKEYKVLECLFLKKNYILTPKDFLAHLYPYETTLPKEEVIDVFVDKLRKKMFRVLVDKKGYSRKRAGNEICSFYISTEFGKGYTMPLPDRSKSS